MMYSITITIDGNETSHSDASLVQLKTDVETTINNSSSVASEKVKNCQQLDHIINKMQNG